MWEAARGSIDFIMMAAEREGKIAEIHPGVFFPGLDHVTNYSTADTKTKAKEMLPLYDLSFPISFFFFAELTTQ